MLAKSLEGHLERVHELTGAVLLRLNPTHPYTHELEAIEPVAPDKAEEEAEAARAKEEAEAEAKAKEEAEAEAKAKEEEEARRLEEQEAS